jgi:hypothetical protein
MVLVARTTTKDDHHKNDNRGQSSHEMTTKDDRHKRDDRPILVSMMNSSSQERQTIHTIDDPLRRKRNELS